MEGPLRREDATAYRVSRSGNEEWTLPYARRSQHWAANGGGAGAEPKGALEARGLSQETRAILANSRRQWKALYALLA